MKIDVVISSTSRYKKFGSVSSPDEAGDASGEVILKKLANAGHQFTYQLLPDGIDPIRKAILRCTSDAMIICGGTGLASLDLTLEAAEPLFDKAIPGFGEIFRLRSLDEVGTRAILTRATAGVVRGIPVFCMPGSPSAAMLGTDLVLAEVEHIIKHVREG